MHSEPDTLSPSIHRVQVLLDPMEAVDTSKILVLQSMEVSEWKNMQEIIIVNWRQLGIYLLMHYAYT